MKLLSLIPIIFTAAIFGGCSTSQGLRMLNDRSEYDNPVLLQSLAVKEGGIEGFKNSSVPVRTRAKVAAIYIFPTETPTRDYFWGAWLSTEVEPSQWVLTKANRTPYAPVTVPQKSIEQKKTAKK